MPKVRFLYEVEGQDPQTVVISEGDFHKERLAMETAAKDAGVSYEEYVSHLRDREYRLRLLYRSLTRRGIVSADFDDWIDTIEDLDTVADEKSEEAEGEAGAAPAE